MTTIKKKIELPKATYVKYSESKPGQTLVTGTFVGTTSVQKYNGGPDEFVPSHVFATDKGDVILNSASSLDRLLAIVEPGTPLSVTFLGKEKKKSKEGKAYTQNMFEVNELYSE